MTRTPKFTYDETRAIMIRVRNKALGVQMRNMADMAICLSRPDYLQRVTVVDTGKMSDFYIEAHCVTWSLFGQQRGMKEWFLV